MNTVNWFQNYQIWLSQGNDNTVPSFLHLIKGMNFLVPFLIFLALQEGTNRISHIKLSSSFIFQADQICLPLGVHPLEMERDISPSLPPQAGKGTRLLNYSVRHCTERFARGRLSESFFEGGFLFATLENRFKGIMSEVTCAVRGEAPPKSSLTLHLPSLLTRSSGKDA